MTRRAGKLERFLRNWWRDIALAGAGAALGLLVVAVVEWNAPSAPETRNADGPPAAVDGGIAARPYPAPAPRARPRAAPPAAPDTLPPPSAAPPLPQWRKFAASHAAIADRPMIAVIIDDMGLDRSRSDRAIALPAPLTLAFLTYALGLRGQAETARRHGHELMIHVPMEPESGDAYPGPKVLAAGLPPDELARRLHWALGRFEGYVGINNHMGSRFTADPAGMELVLAEVRRRGLLFVDSRTSPRSVARQVAERLSVPFVERHVFLDDDPAAEAVRRQLAEVERVAARQGYAVAIGHPRDATLEALETWLPALAEHGFVLVPVSAVVRRRMEAG